MDVPQKSFHSGRSFLGSSPLQKVIGSQHHREKTRRGSSNQQFCLLKLERISGYFSTILSCVLYRPTSFPRQNINPSAFLGISVSGKAPGVITVGVGVAKAQHYRSVFTALAHFSLLHRITFLLLCWLRYWQLVRFLYRMPDYRLPFFRSDLPGITQVNFMVHPGQREVVFITICR